MSQKPLKRKLIKAYMHSAKGFAECSYCARLRVGAVLVKNDSIIGIGYNGRPSGEPNVCETDDNITHPDTRHAEINVLKKVTRSTESSVGSIMFTTHAPCRQCSIDMVDAGIVAVFYEEPYRDTSGLFYLLKHGVKVFRVQSNESIFEFNNKLQCWIMVPTDLDYISL